MKTIDVAKIIDKDLAIMDTDGQKVFDNISEALKNNEIVVLDFSGISLIISAFMNAAIGQLYRDYDSNFLNNKLKIEGLSPDDLTLLKRVNERAKIFYSEKKKEIIEILDKEYENE